LTGNSISLSRCWRQRGSRYAIRAGRNLLPSTSFSQAPWYSLPVHLCRFRVRSNGGLFPGTSKQPNQSNKEELPSRSVTSSWPRNINLVPIDYAFRPSATGSLTLFVATHVIILASDLSTGWLTPRLHRKPRSSKAPAKVQKRNEIMSHYAPLPCLTASSASAHGLSPDTSSPQDNLIRPVSCYAIFKGWLLLSHSTTDVSTRRLSAK